MTLKSLVFVSAGVLTAGLAQAAPLRVLTYNLRYITGGDTGEKAWTARRDQAAELIQADRADIVGIQEGLPQMMNDLGARLDGYAVIGVGREDGINQGEYAAILVKTDRFRIQETGTFWLSDTPDIPNSCTWGNTVTRICTWAKLFDRESGKTFHFFNTHLDHASPEARKKGTALILSRMEGKTEPMVLTGDFNALEEDSLHTAIKKSGLVDAWRSVHVHTPLSESGTFNHFNGAVDGGRIDYIYASPMLKVTESEIIRSSKNGVYPSDHFPVRATLDL